MSSLLNLSNIHKYYPTSGEPFHALKGVDLTIASGEMVAIMGSSGSGKSTLMNILGFLDKASSGRYFFSGQDVSNLAETELAVMRNQKIGFVFQSFYLLPRLNALQNVMLPMLYNNVSSEEASAKAHVLLQRFQLQAFEKHKPNQLSGGQQQRVAIARALANDADLLLADEPTGALDSKTGFDVMQLFHELHQEEKRTILIITHDPKISEHCERVIALRDGKIVVN